MEVVSTVLCECVRQMKTSERNRRERERHKERQAGQKGRAGRENATSLFLWRVKMFFRGK